MSYINFVYCRTYGRSSTTGTTGAWSNRLHAGRSATSFYVCIAAVTVTI